MVAMAIIERKREVRLTNDRWMEKNIVSNRTYVTTLITQKILTITQQTNVEKTEAIDISKEKI